MSFLDSIKSKFSKNQDEDQGEDSYSQEGYDEYYDQGTGSNPYVSYGDETYQTASSAYSGGSYGGDDSGNGVLGQTRRGEAESVAVYTRSGQPVGDTDRHATTYNSSSYDNGSSGSGSYDSGSSYSGSSYSGSQRQSYSASDDYDSYESESAARRSALINGTPQLPAYILRPESYDDVETVVRRVRTRQPVALVFQGVRTEVAKRVLDFSYGFACGLGASVKELGDRVFMVLPEGCEVKDSDIAKLEEQGYLKK